MLTSTLSPSGTPREGTTRFLYAANLGTSIRTSWETDAETPGLWEIPLTIRRYNTTPAPATGRVRVS